ncbi:MAG: hypothetical protein Q8R07_01145, partial [Candidatus Uhrbacteria bacterium]|nr:hypothetical protein [Candidatus Uhrbacteria bacterium]
MAEDIGTENALREMTQALFLTPEQRLSHQIDTLISAISLAAADVAFFAYVPELAGTQPTLCLLCNDTFAYASADAEPVPWDSVQEVKRLYDAGGWRALIDWISERRGV